MKNGKLLIGVIAALLQLVTAEAGTKRWIPKIAAAGGMLCTNSDDFNRGSTTVLGANWTTNATDIPAVEAIFIASNNIAMPKTTDLHSYAVWTNGCVPSNDQFSQVTLSNIGPWNGVCTRQSLGVDSNLFAFVFGANDHRFYRRSGSDPTYASSQLKRINDGSTTWVNGDAFRLECRGTTPVRMYIAQNGSWRDECVTNAGVSGGYDGIATFNPSGSVLGVDNWSGGTIVLEAVATDNFTRTDGRILGPPWVTQLDPTGTLYYGLKIASNKAVYSSGALGNICASTWANDLMTNHYAEITIGVQGSSDFQMVTVSANYVGQTWYATIVLDTLPSTQILTYACDGTNPGAGGEYHLLDTYTSTSFTTGDRLGLTRTYSGGAVHLDISKNGGASLRTITDSTYVYKGTNAGCGIFSVNAVGTTTVTGWSAHSVP